MCLLSKSEFSLRYDLRLFFLAWDITHLLHPMHRRTRRGGYAIGFFLYCMSGILVVVMGFNCAPECMSRGYETNTSTIRNIVVICKYDRSIVIFISVKMEHFEYSKD